MQNNLSGKRCRAAIQRDKLTAEVMAACGVSISEIARTTERPAITIRYWLLPASAEKARERARRVRQRNPEKVRENARRFRESNRESIREQNRKWREHNTEYCKQRWHEYYAANAEKLRERSRAYRDANPEKARRATAAWYSRNRDAVNQRWRLMRAANADWHRERVRAWRADNHELYKALCRTYAVRRRTARRSALIAATKAQVEHRRSLFDGKCAYCSSDQWIVIDHVLAIKQGGLDEPTNLVPACFRCNSSKGSKLVDEWYHSQPFFSEKRWQLICRHSPQAADGQLSLSILGA